jgi:hypothetical protein
MINVIKANNFVPTLVIELTQMREPKTGCVLWCAKPKDISLRFYGPSAEFCLGLMQQRFPNMSLINEPHGNN